MNKKIWMIFITLIFFIGAMAGAYAISPIDGFAPGENGPVTSVAVQPDGKILAAGAFTSIGGRLRAGIARLDIDGKADSFYPFPNGPVTSIAVQPDGKILVAGAFTVIALNLLHPGLARLNNDGSVDTSFSAPLPNVPVTSIVIQPDGKILIGGAFTAIGLHARSGIARLNNDGSVDLAFSANVNLPGAVNSISAQADGKILVAGPFTSIGGQARAGIARLNTDGTVDPAFDPAPIGNVSSVAVQADGKILVAGAFTNIGGQARAGIARLNTDGTADSFNPSPNGPVTSIAVQPDGKILAAGGFTVIALNLLHPGLARLNNDGSVDTSFNAGAPNGSVISIVIQPDGKILVGGTFIDIGLHSRVGIARLNTDGTTETTFDPAANNDVYSIVFQPDGKILAGGVFTNIGGEERNRIARLNTDGTADTTFNPDADSYVNSIAIQPDGKILIGGNFLNIGVEARNYIARLNPDGTVDTTFNPDANGDLVSIVVLPEGKILVGGAFTNIGGQVRNHIARLNPDGTADTAFDPDADGSIHSIVVQSDGMILVGGGIHFNNIGGEARNHIARLYSDGTVDTAFNPEASGSNAEVNAIAVQPDGKILVGGYFTGIGGQARNHIARLNPDGTADTAFDPNADCWISSIIIQSDGKILVGGYFGNIGGAARNFMARLNADGTVDAEFDLNPNNMVHSISIQPDGKILAGGGFWQIGGETRYMIARLTNTDASLQELSASSDGCEITWRRSGAGTEIFSPEFEISTDMYSWTALGTASRMRINVDPQVISVPLDGWELTGLALQKDINFYIRARGYAAGGRYNGSSSIIESIRNIYLTGNAPAAYSQSVTTNENAAINITLSSIDQDSDPLTYIILSGPANGTLSGTAPNKIYTPNPNYNGPDSFTFKVNDGKTDSNIATVSIMVNAINDTPTVILSANPVSGIAPLAVTFTATAYDTDGLISKYEWDLDGSGNYETTATANIVSHKYNISGIFTAKVRVTDNNGAIAVASMNITVGHPVNNTPLGNIDITSPGSNNRVDGFDLSVLSRAFGLQPQNPDWNIYADLDGNNIVDGNDLAILAANFGKKN